jgi:hypothetical protein
MVRGAVLSKVMPVGPIKAGPVHSFPLFHLTRGSAVVKALCYKPEGRGFENR